MELRGRILIDGDPLVAQDVEVTELADAMTASQAITRTDADGRFRVLVRPGRYTVGQIWPSFRSEPVTIDANTEHTFAIRTGKLELLLVDERGEPQRAAGCS